MEIVILRFPAPDITHTTRDGTPYRVTGDALAGVRADHVAELAGIGAVPADAGPETVGPLAERDTTGGFVTDAPKPRSRAKKR